MIIAFGAFFFITFLKQDIQFLGKWVCFIFVILAIKKSNTIAWVEKVTIQTKCTCGLYTSWIFSPPTIFKLIYIHILSREAEKIPGHLWGQPLQFSIKTFALSPECNDSFWKFGSQQILAFYFFSIWSQKIFLFCHFYISGVLFRYSSINT